MQPARRDPPQAREFRGDIQGLRAIAVGGVVLNHAGVSALSGGYVGVDIFFVISGFLITQILLHDLERDGRIGFAAFYAKRARRILPAALLVLVLTVLAAALWVPPLLMEEVWRGAVATAVYVPNVLFALDGVNYLAEKTPSLFQHYWSLGLEEQFYLVWPLVLAMAWRWTRSRRPLLWLIVALVTVSFVACIIVTSWRQPWAFFLLPTRAWELGVGAALALVLSRRPTVVPARFAPALGWAGVAAMLVPMALYSERTAFPGYWAAIPVAGAALVILAGATPARRAPTWLLSRPPMLFIGAISYSLYLIHWPVLQIPPLAVGYAQPLPPWSALVLAALCVPVAWLLYRFVEKPAQTVAWLAMARPRRSLVTAVAVTAVVLLVSTAAYVYTAARPLHVGVRAAETALQVLPSGTPFVPSNLRPTLDHAASSVPPMYDDGCHLAEVDVDLPTCLYGPPSSEKIVLFGDSHAAHWFPALLDFAVAHGYQVESRTKSGCPSVQVSVLRSGVSYRTCDAWRESVLMSIHDSPPALVVIANSRSHQLDGGGDFAEAWQRGMESTLDRIDAPTVVIADTPEMPSTPSICLSAHLDDALACSLSRVEATETPARQAEIAATNSTGTPYIDLLDYFCNAETCDPILGNTLVYRDNNHMTVRFSRLLAPALGAELARVLE